MVIHRWFIGERDLADGQQFFKDGNAVLEEMLQVRIFVQHFLLIGIDILIIPERGVIGQVTYIQVSILHLRNTTVPTIEIVQGNQVFGKITFQMCLHRQEGSAVPDKRPVEFDIQVTSFTKAFVKLSLKRAFGFFTPPKIFQPTPKPTL